MRTSIMIVLAASAAFLLSTAVESQAFAMTRGHHPAKFNSTNGVPVLNTSISCATIRSYAKDMNNETKQKYRKMASPEQISAARRCL